MIKAKIFLKIVVVGIFLALVYTKIALGQTARAIDLNDKFLTLYRELLQKYVHKGCIKDGIETTLVDYKGIKNDKDWKKAKNLLKQVNVYALPSYKGKLAFWINAYNFYILDLVAFKYPINSIQDLSRKGKGLSVWEHYRYHIYGKRYSFKKMEEYIIKEFKDPRAYFALACSGLSCPNLDDKPYTRKNLRFKLKKQRRKFLHNQTKGVKIVYGEGNQDDKIYVSQIFKDHKQDFFHGRISSFISQDIVVLYITGYLNFNWKLNSLDGKYKCNID